MATGKDIQPTQRFLGFSQRISNDLNIVGIDHCYAKPWSSHPGASNARPIQMLFMDKWQRRPVVEKKRDEDVLIDVDGEEPSPPAVYDIPKARAMMLDCDRHANLLRPDFSETREDWEDHIVAVRTTWTVQQNRIFAKVMKVLQADRLSRLSIVGVDNEPVLRRLQIDKAAKRVRFALGNIGWDKSLTLWLHNLLLEKLRGQLLTSYLEVLQKLKLKIPSLIDCLIEGTSSKQGALASESLSGLLKRSWDPVISSINQQKFKKLPENPLILLIPGAPLSLSNSASNKRHKFWHSQLSSMGKVINVVPINNSTGMSIANCVENMVATTRSKILEMKGHFPGRLVVLIGWNVGGLVALHVSLVEVVHAVVCLGFPTMGINGNRGEVDDSVFNCKTPTLYVVGQHASATSLDCLEDMRERLRVETGLLLVGGADDQLRMVRAKKRSSGLTQSMVDRCIMDEAFEFLGSILSKVIVQPDNMEEAEVVKKQQKKRKQKDMSSAAGSQTVEGIVKPPKKIRTMKMANVGTGAFSGHTLATGTSAFGKKSQPRKKLGKMSPDGRSMGQKSYVHLTLPVISSSQGQQQQKPPSKPSLSEAAAIASAPELSTLLQSIKTSTETSKSAGPLISSKISSTAATSLLVPSSSPNVPTTTALTLSKFLASSGLIKPSEDPVPDPKPMDDPASEDIDFELSGKEDSPVKQPPQPQILFKTSFSSSPFSIPLTFSMANKMLKSGAMLKPMTSEASSQQIQQLLTGVSDSSLTPTSLCAASYSDAQASNTTTSTTTPACPSSFRPVVSSALTATLTDSPKASVINIGSDTVYLKENPPSTSSAPGTVSIDLGQIASGNSSNPLKLQASSSSSSRISLIPSMKHIPPAVSSTSSSSSSSSISSLSSSSPERAQVSSPVSFSQAGVTSLSSQSQQTMAVIKTQAKPAVSSPSIHLVASSASGPSHTFKSAPTVLQASPHLGLSALSSSQLLSTLSSGSGVIRFKLASPQTPRDQSGVPEVKLPSQGRDETDGVPWGPEKSSDPFANSSRLPSFIDLTEDNSPPGSKKVSKTVSALAGTQTLSLLSMKTGIRGPSTNLIITPMSSLKPGVCQILKKTPASSSGESQTTPMSPKIKPETEAQTPTQKPAAAETLGEVTSLLKSSPVTLGPPSLPTTKDKVLLSQTHSSEQTPAPPTLSSPSVVSSPPVVSTSSASSLPSTPVHSSGSKSAKSTISTYTATPKTVPSTTASTRTRRIKVPKQYDL